MLEKTIHDFMISKCSNDLPYEVFSAVQEFVVVDLWECSMNPEINEK